MLEGSRLRLGSRIGRGGMAEVFAGKMVGVAGFEKDVAVKRVLPKYAGDPQFLSRFLAEARLAAKLSHPNIVQIFELGQDGRDHYIVMEAVRGVTLRALLDALENAGEKMPVEIAVHIAQCLCAGLAHAHEMTTSDGKPLGVVHRDVSPHNVLLGFAGAVKLIDFGIARAADVPAHTQTGRVLGKPHFMSPEQVRGEEIDARADVFAVGVVLFEMLSGRRPFDGDVVDVVDAIAEGRRLHVPDVEPDLDHELSVVVETALAHELAQRYESARAFGNALLQVQKRLGNGASELEPLLARLFPKESQAPWPVDVQVRVDAKEHTATIDRALTEITLVSDEVLSGDDDPAPNPADITRSDRAAPRKSNAGPIAAGIAVGFSIVVIAAAIVWKATSTTGDALDAGPLLTSAHVDAGAIVAAVPNVADAGAKSAAVDAGAVAANEADAGSFDFDDAGVLGLAASRPHPRKAAPPRMGSLYVETRPWSEVRLNGKLLGITPLRVQVPVGEHALKLTNPEQKLARTVEHVVVSEEKQAKVLVDLRQK